jgi:hypothetical protein
VKIIGISGAARSGKDTFADCLIEVLSSMNIASHKMSFANQLKIEVKDFLQKTIGIDSFTQDDEEKKIIRPFLVTWGTEVRRKQNPNIWIDHVESQLDENKVNIITDVRFGNEMDWLKDKGGYSVFVSRYLENGAIVEPANETESDNNDVLINRSDFQLSWTTVENLNWLTAVVYETLHKLVPEKELQSWTQTCRL